MSISLPIEITKVENGWKVWFGTWSTDREKIFPTAEEAEAFAKQKFAKMKTRFILYPKEWES